MELHPDAPAGYSLADAQAFSDRLDAAAAYLDHFEGATAQAGASRALWALRGDRVAVREGLRLAAAKAPAEPAQEPAQEPAPKSGGLGVRVKPAPSKRPPGGVAVDLLAGW